MEKLEKKNFCIVVVGRIEDYQHNDVLPFFVRQEIKENTNIKVVNQKKASYGLLHAALLKFFDFNDDFLSIKKTENGKPISKDYCFSISHSNKLVAVAISDNNVGLDIQIIDKKINLENIKKRVLHKNESAIKISSYDDLFKLWVQKEAEFKLQGNKSFLPHNIDTTSFASSGEVIEFDGEKYCVCVVTEKENVIKELKFM